MRPRALALGALAACGGGNELAPPGNCPATAAPAAPIVDVIPLAAAPLSCDDLHYAPSLDKVIAAPSGAKQIFLIDPDDNSVKPLVNAIADGIASADAKGAQIFAANRTDRRIEIVDIPRMDLVGQTQLDAAPDYIRASPTTEEVWVTMPGAGRIDTFATSTMPPSATKTGSIAVDNPEGLVFDGAGFAYTNDRGAIVQIDVARHAVVDRWADGCGSSHGFPQVDAMLGLAFGGCSDNGGAGVVATASGTQRSGIEVGGGQAILAYDRTLHHLYLRGDGAPTLDIIGVCGDGGLAVLAEVAIPARGHGAAADGRGRVWVCDPDGGGVLRVTDPFPASP